MDYYLLDIGYIGFLDDIRFTAFRWDAGHLSKIRLRTDTWRQAERRWQLTAGCRYFLTFEIQFRSLINQLNNVWIGQFWPKLLHTSSIYTFDLLTTTNRIFLLSTGHSYKTCICISNPNNKWTNKFDCPSLIVREFDVKLLHSRFLFVLSHCKYVETISIINRMAANFVGYLFNSAVSWETWPFIYCRVPHPMINWVSTINNLPGFGLISLVDDLFGKY